MHPFYMYMSRQGSKTACDLRHNPTRIGGTLKFTRGDQETSPTRLTMLPIRRDRALYSCRERNLTGYRKYLRRGCLDKGLVYAEQAVYDDSFRYCDAGSQLSISGGRR